MMNLLMLTLTLVSVVLGDLVILSTPDGIDHPVPCVRTCSGVGGKFNWKDSEVFHGKVFNVVNITDCSFVSTPVVTVSTRSLRGDLCPSVSFMAYLKTTWFYVYSVENTTATQVKNNECVIHWIATGYTC